MAREKKISFRYFLRGKNDISQLYVRINYATKNTQIKCTWGEADIFWSQEDLESFQKRTYKHNALAAQGNYLLEKEQVITKIVRYEQGRNEAFSIAGIGDLIDFYYTSILNLLRLNAEILFKKDISEFIVAKDYLKIVEHDELRQMYLRAAIDYPTIKESLNENTILAIEAYVFYYLFVTLKEEDKAETNGTFFSWIIGSDKQELPQFMDDIRTKMKMAKAQLSGFDLVEKCPPQKNRLEKYLQTIDLEVIKRRAMLG